ncbi:thiosulfate reductase/polysulfide reductase chain A [Lebetimonas natsushimae]|uniref:Thiosulfate reductase/polysulfide reductase chain A n=1 Tax=Lebetimonas natsushimae TaxID=1936991 RepID=A0A292YD23_9BACT|nr:molybdopterin-dependent oxidoreductase [Lebetimonas natsushimae]GAX87144.1 thiosulfate reductase/polysulfide reductase chain A [Lebetimonas natsushimae]
MSEIVDLKRRSFLKGSAAAAAGAAVVSTSAFAFGPYEEAANEKEKKEKEIKNAKFTPNVCGMCVNMCGVIVRSVDGKVKKIDPNPLYPKSRNFMCARGNAGIAEEYDPDRITTPLIRVGKRGEGKFRKASWDEAFDYIAKKMVKILDEEKDNRSTFLFGVGATSGTVDEPVVMNLVNGIGTANFIDHFSTCFAPSFMANALTFGSWGQADFRNTKYLLNLGANRAEGIVTPDTMDMFKRTHKRGIEKIVYIDVRYTNTAAQADEFIPIKPGTDGALMLAMIHETINKGYHKTPYKADYIAKYVDGIEELEEFFTKGEGAKYTPEWAEKITEIPASTIRRLTKEFSDAAEKYKGAANCYRSRKSTWYYQDFEFRRAQAIFNAIHGCVNRPGGIILGRGLKFESYEYEDFPVYDNPKPRIDIACLKPNTYPLANPQKGSWPIIRDTILEVNTKWRKGEKLADNEYPVRAAFHYKQNPLQSVPDYEKTAKMYETMDLVVVIDIQATDTALYADVILPDTVYVERESPIKMFNTIEPYITWRSKAVEPRGYAQDVYFMCKELAKRIEKPFAAITFKYTWDADDLGAELPKDFDLAKYLTDDFEVDEEKLKADIKDEKLVKAILQHASEDDLDIGTYKITAAFEKTVEEYNEETMKELYGEEAAKIAKEWGVYWPGIENAVKSDLLDEHLKAFKKETPDKNELAETIYQKFTTLPKDYYIVPKKGKYIKLAQKTFEGKKFTNPITGKLETMHRFPLWRDSLYKAPNTEEGEVRVVVGRHAYFTQSFHPNNYLLLDLMNYNYLWINDELAKKLGLRFKDEVELTSEQGKKVIAKVYPTKRIRKDTAFIATGFGAQSPMMTLGYKNGISQAMICENTIDPIIGSASMNETLVKIRKV